MKRVSRLFRYPSGVVLCIAVLGLLLASLPAHAGKLTINCWEFNRGNAKVMDNPAKYGDYRDEHPDLMLIAGDEQPWFVEYDLEFPSNATYKVRTRFASTGEYPLDILIDGKRVGQICLRMTGNNPPYIDRHPRVHEGLPKRKWHLHGAEWENSCEIKVTKGKHTLKLMRNGPPANPIRIQLSADGPAVTRTNLPDADVVLARIPVRYRNVLLFRDGRSVNIGGLHVAIKDHIKTFGPEYPRGAQYLTALADLEKQQALANAGSSPEQAQELHDGWEALRQKVMLGHPSLKFDKLLFILKRYREVSTYTGHINPQNDGGGLCMLSPVAPDGKVTRLVPELTNGAFGRFDISFDATKVVFCYAEEGGTYRLYEIGIDPATGLRPEGSRLRELTAADYEKTEYGNIFYAKDGGYNDIDPIYLPNGKILFCSTRCQRSVLCFPATVTALHIMDGDGKNIRCISQGQVNEISPCVLDDGRVVYMRWEYVDKGFANVQSLWAVRPDGSGSDHVFKNMLVCPGGMMHARSVPNSRKLVATATGHHGGHQGPIVLIDNRRHRRFTDALESLTPEIRYPGMGPIACAPLHDPGTFRDPYPFSEKFFLVSHKPGRVEYAKGAGFALYALDTWGNRAELYRNQEFSCQQPMPLLPRRNPTDIAPVAPTPKEVQPILDKHCIGCHGGKEPKGGLVLTDEPTRFFNRSYESLTSGQKGFDSAGLVSYLRTSGFGSSHVPLEPPLSFGSHRSKMIAQIRKEPCRGDITREEFIRIVTWIDANAPFYGTHDGKKNIKWKNEPDFRPDPVEATLVVSAPVAMK